MAGLVFVDEIQAFVREHPPLSNDEAEWARQAAAREAERERVRAAQEAEREAARLAREREAAEAKGKAEALLLSLLDEQQTADYRANQNFTVRGSNGKRYLIRLGRAHNIFELNDAGTHVTEICGHVSEHVPDEDNLVAQKLALETDAEGFLRIANSWSLPRR